MVAKVVDASALAAVLLVEPEASRIVARLEGCELVAPSLIEFEVGNVCWKRAQREPDKARLYRQALQELAALDLAIQPIDAQAVWQLALHARLTFYDASYLWLARSLGVELVTLDQSLAAAAARQDP